MNYTGLQHLKKIIKQFSKIGFEAQKQYKKIHDNGYVKFLQDCGIVKKYNISKKLLILQEHYISPEVVAATCISGEIQQNDPIIQIFLQFYMKTLMICVYSALHIGHCLSGKVEYCSWQPSQMLRCPHGTKQNTEERSRQMQQTF